MPRRRSRRQLLSLLSGAAATAMAGCAGLAQRPPGTGGSSGAQSPTVAPPTKTPGYKDYHWHGRLFFEIDGRLVDFSKPKYHLENIENEQEALGFHFHKSAHGVNEWSNELRVVTFAEGLNLLPGIGYRKLDGGRHEVRYEGTTYREGDGAEITIAEGTQAVDPTRHYVRHGEVFWVRVDTGEGGPTPPADHGDARVGTLVVDINDRRLDSSQSEYMEANIGSDAFHYHDDGHPYRWYVEGGPVTLAKALNALPGVTYEASGGDDVVTVEGQDKYSGTYRSSDRQTTITIRQRTTDVRPPEHSLVDGDILWVYVHTDDAPDNEH